MSEDKFRLGDVVSIRGKICAEFPSHFIVETESARFRTSGDEMMLVKRELSIGDKVTGANLDTSLLDVAGEIIGIHNNQAWIVRPDGTYTVCPLAGLKAV